LNNPRKIPKLWVIIVFAILLIGFLAYPYLG
jgi:hypothetical protein